MKFVIPESAKSWVEVASDSDFPIQNMPFAQAVGDDGFTILSRIGDLAVDCVALADEGLLEEPGDLYQDLGILVAERGPEGLRDLRKQLYGLLESSNGALRDNAAARETALRPVDNFDLTVPMPIGAFVDFYSGIHHASNVGKMFRPDQPPLLPNYRHIPIGYNGRASSVVPSGTDIIRPCGQTKGPNDEMPRFGPTQEMDFELEMGFFVGRNTAMGETISVGQAEDLMLGLVLVNDWSARDVQRWEYQPLGPFLAKSFATSISPWIVTLDALEPFRRQGMTPEPAPLPHLAGAGPAHFEIALEVWLEPEGGKAERICTSNAMNLYWSFAQQLAHQCSNGTPLEVGDLYASGTISGEAAGSFGSMLELTWRGQQPLTLADGSTRTFLKDGDAVIFRAFAQGQGFRVGFGEVKGRVLAAKTR